jgi:hypothetical protein
MLLSNEEHCFSEVSFITISGHGFLETLGEEKEILFDTASIPL